MRGVLVRVTNFINTPVPFPPELVEAKFVRDSALHGALALILEALAA